MFATGFLKLEIHLYILVTDINLIHSTLIVCIGAIWVCAIVLQIEKGLGDCARQI